MHEPPRRSDPPCELPDALAMLMEKSAPKPTIQEHQLTDEYPPSMLWSRLETRRQSPADHASRAISVRAAHVVQFRGDSRRTTPSSAHATPRSPWPAMRWRIELLPRLCHLSTHQRDLSAQRRWLRPRPQHRSRKAQGHKSDRGFLREPIFQRVDASACVALLVPAMRLPPEQRVRLRVV